MDYSYEDVDKANRERDKDTCEAVVVEYRHRLLLLSEEVKRISADIENADPADLNVLGHMLIERGAMASNLAYQMNHALEELKALGGGVS